MEKQKNIIIGILVILVIVLGAIVFTNRKEAVAPIVEENKTSTESTLGTETSNTTNSQSQGTVRTTSKTTKPTPAAIVTYTNEGFDPSIATIKQGQSVLFINKSSESLWVASNPHPSHSMYPAFDERTSIGPNGTFQFTFTQVGKWRYHNHLRSLREGTIVVDQNF